MAWLRSGERDKMETNEFERQLGRQSLRRVPSEWRAEILSAVEGVYPDSSCDTHHGSRAPWWRELLWPCPQAWAGLAAVWAVVLVLNLASREPAQVAKTSKAAPAPELLIALREHRRLLAELIGSPAVVEPPKPFEPRPRSEIPRPIATVQFA